MQKSSVFSEEHVKYHSPTKTLHAAHHTKTSDVFESSAPPKLEAKKMTAKKVQEITGSNVV